MNHSIKVILERLLHLNPDDCKNELLRLNITQIKTPKEN